MALLSATESAAWNFVGVITLNLLGKTSHFNLNNVSQNTQTIKATFNLTCYGYENSRIKFDANSESVHVPTTKVCRKVTKETSHEAIN